MICAYTVSLPLRFCYAKAGAKGSGRLFYRGARKGERKSAGRRHASKGVANHLAAWVRENGFEHKRKAPNHAFRHWFKTACQKAGVLDSVADAIQGHRADIFGLKGQEDVLPESETKVHICTIQGLVKRVLFAADASEVFAFGIGPSARSFQSLLCSSLWQDWSRRDLDRKDR